MNLLLEKENNALCITALIYSNKIALLIDKCVKQILVQTSFTERILIPEQNDLKSCKNYMTINGV